MRAHARAARHALRFAEHLSIVDGMTRQDAPRAAVVRLPGTGRPFDLGPVQTIFKADGEETRGHYAISEWWLEPYTRGPGAHKHEEDDVFYVLEGTLTFFVGGEWVEAPKGSLVIA